MSLSSSLSWHALMITLAVTYLVVLTEAGKPPMLATTKTSYITKVLPHEVVKIRCPVQKNKDIIFEWYKEKELILPYSDVRFKIESNGNLIIFGVHYFDSGVYRCRAINGFGSLEFNTTLVVLGKSVGNEYYNYECDQHHKTPVRGAKIELTYKARILYFSETESPVHKKIGEFFVFHCLAVGHPTPNVSWYKDGKEISSPRMGRWSLKFTDARREDSGNYTCEVSNILGKESRSVKLMVDEALETHLSFDFTLITAVLVSTTVLVLASFGCLIYCEPCRRFRNGSTNSSSREESTDIELHSFCPETEQELRPQIVRSANHLINEISPGQMNGCIDMTPSEIEIEVAPPNSPVESIRTSFPKRVKKNEGPYCFRIYGHM